MPSVSECRMPVATAPAERLRDLGPRRETTATPAPGSDVSTTASPCGVDDDDPAAGVLRRTWRRSAGPMRRRSPPLERRPRRATASATASRSTLVVRSLPLVAREGDPERDLEGQQDEERERQVAREQPTAHPGSPRRKPTPRTVSIQPGSPSFRRSEATWTSIVFVGPYQCVSHTSSRSCWRRDDRAGVGGEDREQIELLRRQRDLAPSTLTRRAADVDLERCRCAAARPPRRPAGLRTRAA